MLKGKVADVEWNYNVDNIIVYEVLLACPDFPHVPILLES